MFCQSYPFVPAEAGTQGNRSRNQSKRPWIPACGE